MLLYNSISWAKAGDLAAMPNELLGFHLLSLVTLADRMLPPALAAHMGKPTGLSELAVPMEPIKLNAEL